MTTLTVREARAVMALKGKVEAAVETFLRTIEDNQSALDYALAYYASHLRDCVDGRSYGCAPIHEAQRVLAAHAVKRSKG